MFDTLFYHRQKAADFRARAHKHLDFPDAAAVPVIFSEHCLECSPPQCYTSCGIYLRRRDGRCSRVTDGILPLGRPLSGQMEAAYLQFRRWGKVECAYDARTLPRASVQRLYRRIRRLDQMVNGVFAVLPARWERAIRFVGDGWFSVRRKMVLRALSKRGTTAKALTLVFHAQTEVQQAFIVEVRDTQEVLFRSRVDLRPDKQDYSLPLPALLKQAELVLSLYPEDFDNPTELTILGLELVEAQGQQDGAEQAPAATDDKTKKIKCVVWDLDNTLWQGVLVEGGSLDIDLFVLETIQRLDSQGIVSSICSKNDYDAANQRLTEAGIRDLFVFPRINWDPKSVNIKDIADSMNISPSAMAFVDDSPFERHEVETALPEVFVIDVLQLEEALSSPRFQVKTSAESKGRRHTYQMMEQQQAERATWQGDNDQFLINCDMHLSISIPTGQDLPRCHELVMRTNQLNISGRTLTMEEIKQSVTSPEWDVLALRCKDKFGDYGLVGFLRVSLADGQPTVTDFFLSCRVANRKIEFALFKWLWSRYQRQAMEPLRIDFRRTPRNTPIKLVVERMVSQEIAEHDQPQMLIIDRDKLMAERDVLTVHIDAGLEGGE